LCGSHIFLPKAILTPRNAIARPNGVERPGICRGRQKGSDKSNTRKYLPLPDRIFKILSKVRVPFCAFDPKRINVSSKLRNWSCFFKEVAFVFALSVYSR